MQVVFYELLTQQRYFAAARDETHIEAMLLGAELLPHETDAARSRNSGLGALRQCALPLIFRLTVCSATFRSRCPTRVRALATVNRMRCASNAAQRRPTS